MSKHTWKIFFTMCAGAASSSPAVFADAVSDTLATNLKEVNVTASKTSANTRSIAPTIKIDSEKIQTEGITDISDALMRIPGINLRDYGGSGGMKTVSVRGLGAQHTAVIYDGATLGDVQGGQIDLSRYSLNNINALVLNIGDAEDIFLPARSLAASSLLSISTMKDPDLMSDSPELSAGVKLGSFTTINPFFHIALSNGSAARTGTLGMTLNGEYLHAKNDYPFTLANGTEISHEKRNNSQLNTSHAEWNGIWKPNAHTKLQAKIHWYGSSRHLPGPVIYYNDVNHERLKENNAFGQLNYTMQAADALWIKAMARFNHSRTRYSDENGIYPGGKLDRKYLQKEEYGTFSLLWKALKGLDVSYSADFWHNSFSSNAATDVRPLRNSLLQSVSLKWDWWRITATAKGLLSIIHDKSESVPSGKTEKRLSPSLALMMRPLANSSWRIRCSYKDIFRMPTFNELYFDHYGSVNLQPEKTRQLNMGTTYELPAVGRLEGVSATIDGFYNEVRNKIVAIPYNMFVMTMTNLGKVRILGLDATLSGGVRLSKSHKLSLSVNYSYQRAASRTDRNMLDWMKQIAYTPLNSGSASLNWENPWVNLVVHSTASSSRYSTNLNIPSTRLGGYAEMGLTLYRDFKVKRNIFEVRADAMNLLDKQYEIVARYPMPGRRYSITLIYKYK